MVWAPVEATSTGQRGMRLSGSRICFHSLGPRSHMELQCHSGDKWSLICTNLINVLAQFLPVVYQAWRTSSVPGLWLGSEKDKGDLDWPSSLGSYGLTFCDSIPRASVAGYFWKAMTGFSDENLLHNGPSCSVSLQVQ